MSSRAGFRLLALVLTATTVLGAPLAAHAERAVTHDATADVVSLTRADLDAEEVVAPAPEHTNVDITRTVVQHRTDRLRVTVRLRDLELRRRTIHFTAIRVVTPTARFWLYVGNLGGKAEASLDRGDRTIDCLGLRWSQDEDADQVKASLPTSCLDSPRWVQIGVGAVEFDKCSVLRSQRAGSRRALEPEQTVQFVDDGHRAGSVGENSIAKGPKVRRG